MDHVLELGGVRRVDYYQALGMKSPSMVYHQQQLAAWVRIFL